MKEIKVSIVIPMYNAEEFAGECIGSIQRQTLKEIEIICVDDGSTDRTVDVVKSLQDADERIILSEQAHRSAAAARNAGILLAKGEYLAILDVDDYYHDNMLERMYEMGRNSSAEVVVCQSGIVYEKTGIKKNVAGDHLRIEHIPEEEIFNIHKRNHDFGFFNIFVGWAWDKLFKTDYIRKNQILFQDQKSINDMLFVYSALSKADRICVVREPLVDKRARNRGSISSDFVNNKLWEDSLRALYALKQRLIEWFLFDELERDYINYAAHFTIYNLGRFLASNSFDDFVLALQGEWGNKLGFNTCSEDDFFDLAEYRIISLLQNTSCEEFKIIIGTIASEEHFLFPYELIDKGSDIIIYSAGNVGKDFYNQISYSGYCNIVGWVDQKAYNNDYSLIKKPQDIMSMDYDKVIIAVADNRVADGIKQDLIRMGVEEQDIVWRSPRYI